MPAHPFSRPAALTLALGLAGLPHAAQALNIVFKDIGATAMSSPQFAAFESAANYWESRLTDNVTVYISIGFDDLGSGTLGTATWAYSQANYSDLRGHLAADAKSATDASAVSHLQAGPALSFLATQPDLTTRLDNDGSVNNTTLRFTTANAKALGLGTPTNAGSPDAVIRFANGFASSFAYHRTGGQVPFDKIDFITVAEHEIGHALGFVSGVDGIDFCLRNAAQCGTTEGFDDNAWYSTLDLFRYSAAGTLNLTVGGDPKPYFSIDGGASSLQSFSTGRFNGDGNQASHFSAGSTVLMGPFIPYGQSYDATATDLRALDAIGWDVATAAVPEPQVYALLLSGLAVLGWARRRRAAPTASAAPAP
jgi:hypothetical protein